MRLAPGLFPGNVVQASPTGTAHSERKKLQKQNSPPLSIGRDDLEHLGSGYMAAALCARLCGRVIAEGAWDWGLRASTEDLPGLGTGPID
jgi:hypothetical protein